MLFPLFVSDISHSISGANYCLFADSHLRQYNKCHKQLEVYVLIEGNSILQRLSERSCANMKKTKAIDFSLRKQTKLRIDQIILGDFDHLPQALTV